MSKHTPGPWLQSWDCDPPTGSDASPKYDGFEVVNNSGWPIAFVPIHFVFPPVRAEQNKRELDWDEASANLRLIAAAPDLLEALKELHKRLIKCSSDPISAAEAYDSFYQEIVLSAIDKAEGKA